MFSHKICAVEGQATRGTSTPAGDKHPGRGYRVVLKELNQLPLVERRNVIERQSTIERQSAIERQSGRQFFKILTNDQPFETMTNLPKQIHNFETITKFRNNDKSPY